MTGRGLGEEERMEGVRETEKRMRKGSWRRKEGKEEGGGKGRNWMRTKQKSLLFLQNGSVLGKLPWPSFPACAESRD